MDKLVGKKIAIIPARGGSKRIPKKNVVDFMGRPMLAWTVQAAVASELFDRVLVSTDDFETARVAIDFGAEAPFLRDNLADDHSSVSEATAYALKQAMSYWMEKYDVVVQLMPNCPMRTSADIREAMVVFEEGKSDYQISCFKPASFSPWWAATVDRFGQPSFLFPEARVQRSQDLPELYCPTGAIWIAKASSLIQTMDFYAPGHRFSVMKLENAIDIDDYQDLDLARTLFVGRRDGDG